MKCGFLIFDGFSNMVLASAIEPLRAARDMAGPDSFSWRILSISSGSTASSSGLIVQSDAKLADARDLDALFVVAGYGARGHAIPNTIKSLQSVSRKTPLLAGLDSGAWLLATAGLLNGRRATVHWQDLSLLAEQHLDVTVVDERFVIDGNRITAGGAAAVFDLMLRLIHERGGGALAFDVATMFSREARPAAPQATSHTSPLVKAVNAMRAHLERPLSLPALSAAAAVSPRTLARLFEREFGSTPGRYYQRIRLAEARAIVEETALSASEIADRTGFSSAACLSRAFGEHFGQTMRSARQRRRSALRR